jgi:hypothetical protein
MINKIKTLWKNNSFEFVLIGCLIVIAILALTRIGKKGSWSTDYIYNPYKKNKNKGVLDYIDSMGNSSRTTFDHDKKPQRDSSGETECRRVLQKHFRRPFTKCRPNFLNNPVTGGHFNMELDCFDSELKIAVEYNGAQHYKYLPFFHKNKEAFYNQKYRDELKTRMCRDNGIILIEVPYTVKVQDIERHIINELRKHSIHL